MTTVTAATAGLGLVLAAVFWFRPAWGLYALIVALPLERLGSWALNPVTGHPVVRLSQIVGAALVAAYLARLATGRTRLTRPGAAWWVLAAFVASAGVSAWLVGRPALLSGWIAAGFVAVLAWVVAHIGQTASLAHLRNVLLAGGGAVAMFGLYQFVAGALGLGPEWTGLREAYQRDILGFPRVQSTALEPLYFANYLLLPLIVGIATWQRERWFRRWQNWCLVVIMLAFLLTMSRGAFIGLAVAALGAGLWLVARRTRGERIRWSWRPLVAGTAGMAVVGVLLVGMASWAAKGDFWAGPRQFAGLVSTQLTQTGSFSDRSNTRDQAFAIWQSHPWWGVGITGISPYLLGYPEVRTPGDIIALNSQAPELLAETGLIGAGLFYGFLGLVLVQAARSAWKGRGQEQAWLLGLSLVVVAMTVQAQSFSGFLLTHLWVSYGLLAGITIRTQNKA